MARKPATPSPSWFDDPQYRAFEADIVEHPDDDTPRLVLADWLDEHGDEAMAARAEFIRVQIEVSKLEEHAPRHAELTRRADELLRVHKNAWFPPFPEVLTEAVWQRGFIQKLKLGVRKFIDHADELFRLAPILHLQLLRISQTKMTMSKLAACPHFGRLHGLSLPESAIGDNKLAVFLGEANLEKLESLELRGAGVGQETLMVLAEAAIPRLRLLDLSNNHVGGSLESLCSEKVRFKLRELRLSYVSLGPEGREVLFRWNGLAEVEKLDLSANRLGTAGGAELAGCPYLGALRVLDLNYCEIGSRGMQAIADASAFPDLRELNLCGNQIRPSGFGALLHRNFLHLQSLRLSVNLLGNTSMERLAAWPGLARMTTLDLRGNDLGPTGIEALCKSPHLGNLTTLVLSENSIGEEGARFLAQCPHLEALRRLEVKFCQLTESGAVALEESPYLKKLEQLHLYGNGVSRDCAKRLLPRFGNVL